LFNIINSRWKMKTAHSGSLEDNFLSLGKVKCEVVI